MPRQRKPERDKAKEIYLRSKGKLKPKDIAKQLGIDSATIRKWKNLDQWDAELHRKKRGGQPGNQNAKGNQGGAPNGNRNAETHGAYSTPRIERWSEEDRKCIEELRAEFDPLAESQLKKLMAKQMDLERRIADLDAGEEEDDQTLYLDRVMTMELPSGQEMKYRSESSAHARRMVYEAELNRVQGRIIKLLDSIRGKEDAVKRLAFERERFQFEKEKALGVFSIQEDGENDAPDSEIEEIVE